MTYKLEPGLNRIVSPVDIILPDGKHMKYSSGTEVCEAAFDHKYVVGSIRATDNKIEITLSEAELPNSDETFF